MSYNEMEKGFQYAFSSAVKSYRRGSIAVGCAIMTPQGECVSMGENSVYANDENERVNRHHMAHAEINAILKAESGHQALGNVVYTTMEPCVMCFGAMVTCYYEKVKFAAADPYHGASKLKAHYKLQIEGPFKPLQDIQVALNVYRGLKLKLPHVNRTIEMYKGICDGGVELGKKLYNDIKFNGMINDPTAATDGQLFDYMFDKLS